MTFEEIKEKRECSIVKKSNEMVQKAKYELTSNEVKIMSYIFSMVQDSDEDNKTYEFNVTDYMSICGLEKNGRAYRYIKNQILDLKSKSFWICSEENVVTTVSWIEKAWIDEGNGDIKVRLDSDMQKYVKGIINGYTTYSLLYILPMRSKYSIRLYELLKSYSNLGKYETKIDFFKKIMECENYTNFSDLKRFVLEKAIEEINEYSDIAVSYDTKKKGRKVIGLTFSIRKRSGKELKFTKEVAHHLLDGE